MTKKQTLLASLLDMLGLQDNRDWGKYSITINRKTFSDIHSIPLDFLRHHPRLETYHIHIEHTDDQLKAFIVFRLVDKLEYEYQKKELNLTQQKLPFLVLDEVFMSAFLDFLKTQTRASIVNDLENRILTSMRQENHDIRQDYKAKSPLRQSNVSFRKHMSKEADQRWERVVKIASKFNGS